jgi:hypothetical protein
MRNRQFVIGLVVALVFILAWSPWLDSVDLRSYVLSAKGRIDGSLDKDGNLVCDYAVNWLPFGRMVTSCEGSYFVTFFGAIVG